MSGIKCLFKKVLSMQVRGDRLTPEQERKLMETYKHTRHLLINDWDTLKAAARKIGGSPAALSEFLDKEFLMKRWKDEEDKAKEIADVPQHFICALTGGLLKNPVDSGVGIIYSRAELETWIDQEHTHPVTRGPLRKEELVSVVQMNDAVTEYRKSILKTCLEKIEECLERGYFSSVIIYLKTAIEYADDLKKKDDQKKLTEYQDTLFKQWTQHFVTLGRSGKDLEQNDLSANEVYLETALGYACELNKKGVQKRLENCQIILLRLWIQHFDTCIFRMILRHQNIRRINKKRWI